MDWKYGVVVCIPKKGNLTECDNWRGVILLSIPGKVYCQMILNRMRDMVDGELREEQADVRPKCSCAQQIFTFRHIIEKHQKLITYGIPRKIVSAIETIYEQSRRYMRCCVKAEDGYRDWFHMVTGVRQDCILSPFSSPWVMRLATRDNEGITCVKEERLSDLDFADDIAALSNTPQGLQCLMESVARYADGLGLVIIEKKT